MNILLIKTSISCRITDDHAAGLFWDFLLLNSLKSLLYLCPCRRMYTGDLQPTGTDKCIFFQTGSKPEVSFQWRSDRTGKNSLFLASSPAKPIVHTLHCVPAAVETSQTQQ